MVSRVIEKAAKFETQSHYESNIQEKLKPFLEICDISKVHSDAEETTPLSPKRPESPTGKKQKIHEISIKKQPVRNRVLS